MKFHQETLEIRTAGKGLSDITDRIAAVVAHSRVETGACQIFIQHTSASLIIQENADDAVLRDLERWLSEIAPEARNWEHDAEGPDDMPAHARSAITKTSECIPISGGRLALGTWQGVYLWEHRRRAHPRRIVVNAFGNE